MCGRHLFACASVRGGCRGVPRIGWVAGRMGPGGPGRMAGVPWRAVFLAGAVRRCVGAPSPIHVLVWRVV